MPCRCGNGPRESDVPFFRGMLEIQWISMCIVPYFNASDAVLYGGDFDFDEIDPALSPSTQKFIHWGMALKGCGMAVYRLQRLIETVIPCFITNILNESSISYAGITNSDRGIWNTLGPSAMILGVVEKLESEGVNIPYITDCDNKDFRPFVMAVADAIFSHVRMDGESDFRDEVFEVLTDMQNYENIDRGWVSSLVEYPPTWWGKTKRWGELYKEKFGRIVESFVDRALWDGGV